MDRKTMRKRGWSIHSSEHDEGDSGGSPGRKTSDATMTEGEDERPLSDAEKLALLEEFPSSAVVAAAVEHHHLPASSVATGGNGATKAADGQPPIIDIVDDDEEFSTGDVNDDPDASGTTRGRKDDDFVDMFGDDDDSESDSRPAKKRRRTDRSGGVNVGENKRKTELLGVAKGRLSKWAARLFDPDRPRGLVEPPQVIPLNDEFLTAFGKREKEFDDATGREIDIDRGALDGEEDDNGNVRDGEEEQTGGEDSKRLDLKKPPEAVEGCKVKITNLAYTTTEMAVKSACERFGPVVEVNLIMNKEKVDGAVPLNTGRAYVVFETPDFATDFINGMNDKALDGRILRVAPASAAPVRKRSTSGQTGGALARYWERDICTKCFNCGEVGHMASRCPNKSKEKPCPFCAQTGHDTWTCPLSKICFNCGVPGHINRDCPQRRGLPKRMVCGTCFHSGHNRWSCREQAYNVPTHDAKCMVCGRGGHFMCSEMRFFFGLEGISCYNCGQAGHHGLQCDRPRLNVCARDGEAALKEIERAEAFSLADELASQQSKRAREGSRERGRATHRDRNDNYSRAKSQPLRGPRGGNEHDGRGYNPAPSSSRRSYNEPQRGYSPPPQNSGYRGSEHDRNRGKRPSDPRNQRGYR